MIKWLMDIFKIYQNENIKKEASSFVNVSLNSNFIEQSLSIITPILPLI